MWEISNTKEERIQKSFDSFFSEFENISRRSSDFKQYNRSIYNILCTSYKNTDNKIDWKYIIKTFVQEDKRNNFQHTNIYNYRWIIKKFKEFFLSQKQQGKTTWTVSDLENRNESLLITLARKYGYKNTQVVDREKCIEDYKLDKFWCIFKRDRPIRTPILIENINKKLKEIIKKNGKWSPSILHNQKPQYLRWFGRKYRDKEWKIDRLYIIHKVFDDEKIIKAFRHRYAYDRLLKVPEKIRKGNVFIDLDPKKHSGGDLNPEEILINKEHIEEKEKMIKMMYKSIEKTLSEEEKNQLFWFLEWNEGEKSDIDSIIQKIKENIDINV